MKDSLTNGGTIHMIVSNFQSSEPAYGTGPSGVAAVGPTWAWFIANPLTSAALRQSIGSDDVLHIYSPNGTSLNVDYANNFILSAMERASPQIPTTRRTRKVI